MEQRLTRCSDGHKAVLSNRCSNDIKECWKKFFHFQTQQENIRKGNFYFLKFILFSQNSIHTVGKFELIGKITLYLSGLVSTLTILCFANYMYFLFLFYTCYLKMFIKTGKFLKVL